MTVTYELRDRVAIITIDRPGRRNAVDAATARALGAAWRRFDRDDDAHVGVLYGANGHFSSGADLKAFDVEDLDDGPLGFTRTVVSKPTIAAIEGYCVAGGLEMALWCDLRVASFDAIFGCFERRFGIPLIDGGTQRLPRLIGHGLAMELILTGRAVDAEEAHAVGLVNMVTSADRVLDQAIEWAEGIASHPQATLRSDRLALIEGSVLPMDEGLEVERSHGRGVMHVARAGADHFSTGEGRSGAAVRALVAVPPQEEGTDLPWNRVPPTSRAKRRPFEDLDLAEAPDDAGAALAERDEVDSGANSEATPETEHTALAPALAATEAADPVAHHSTEASAPAVPWGGREGNQVDLGAGRMGYFIAPVVERGRSLVVLSDLGEGLSRDVLDASDRLADLGHSALAIDLFGANHDPENLDPDSVVRLVATAIDTLIAGGFAARGTVGLAGFGVGGALAMWIAGLEERVNAVVAFGPHSPWSEIGVGWRLAESAYLCHQSDSRQPAGAPDSARSEIELRDLGLDATFHVYPGVDVTFYKPESESFDKRLSDLAWHRTELFLDRHI